MRPAQVPNGNPAACPVCEARERRRSMARYVAVRAAAALSGLSIIGLLASLAVGSQQYCTGFASTAAVLLAAVGALRKDRLP
jgi:hypothetical protein